MSMKRIRSLVTSARWNSPSVIVLFVSVVLSHMLGYVLQTRMIAGLRSALGSAQEFVEEEYGSSGVEAFIRRISARSATEAEPFPRAQPDMSGRHVAWVAISVTPTSSDEAIEQTVMLAESVVPAFGTGLVAGYANAGLRVTGTWELVARVIESMATRASGAEKLCRGTRSLPPRELCQASANLVQRGESIRSELRKIRFVGLLLGPIQYWCYGLGLFVLVMGVHKKRTLGETGKLVTLQSFASSDSIPHAMAGVQKELYEQSVTALQRVSVSLRAVGVDLVTTVAKLNSSVLDRVNQEKRRFDDQLRMYRTTADVIGSLAFLGTIVGIILAMFELVASQTARPLDASVARLKLYNSMGLAFGTTAVGLSIGTLLTVFLERISVQHKTFLNSVYDQISDFTTNWDPGLVLKNPKVESRSSFLDRVFVLAASLLILAMLVAYLTL